MKEAIIEKLSRHLAEGINREADIVYLLVEIRKLFEHDDLPQYPQLRFYGDWVVHTKLSKIRLGGVLEEYLKKINEVVAAYKLGNSQEDVSARITNAMSFNHLKGEMTTFFQERTLDESLLKLNQWRNFIKLLINILIDSPLIVPKHNFNFIKEFSFTRSKDRAEVVRFKILCTDGKIITGPVFVS